MDLNNFYLFGSEFSKTSVELSNNALDFDTSCRIVKADFDGINFPLVFKQFSGTKWTDILRPSSVSLYIVSHRFVELLERNNVIGWKPYAVKILDKQGNIIEGFSGLSILGKCGGVDYSKSEVYEKQLFPNGTKNKYYKGLHIGLDIWDGSDIFIPENTLHIIVTEKVTQIIEQHKITNVSLQNLSEYEIPEFALPRSS